jgi:serine/threonine protein kinase
VLRQSQVLVVDDEPLVRRLVRDVVTGTGLAVVEANDVESALSQVHRCQPDLVITDYHMPGRKGLALVEELRESHPQLPVVVLTGEPSLEAAVQCLKSGAADYLTKPLDLETLRRVIEERVERAPPPKFDPAMGTILVTRSRPRRRVVDFEVIRTLGEGNMGVVYLVRRESEPDREFALKVLRNSGPSDGLDREETYARFTREAETASAVCHPNVIDIIDYGEDEQGTPYIAMAYIRGRSLRFFIGRPGITVAEKASLLRSMALGLGAIHATGVCHRDIKPENIMVTPDLVPIIMDFGIARTAQSNLTMADGLIGTPTYLSPEACETSRVDARADVFALGVVAYELLTGSRPFDDKSLVTLIFQIRNNEPPPPAALDPACPVGLSEVVMKMLAKTPAARYPDGAAVATALARFCP